MNRRDVLGLAATAAGGLALPRTRVFAQGSGPGAEMITLSTYMATAAARPVYQTPCTTVGWYRY